jgi:hypothetical protein
MITLDLSLQVLQLQQSVACVVQGLGRMNRVHAVPSHLPYYHTVHTCRDLHSNNIDFEHIHTRKLHINFILHGKHFLVP